jgi:hypothetical protein
MSAEATNEIVGAPVPACGKWPADIGREFDVLISDERVLRALEDVATDESVLAGIVAITRTHTGARRMKKLWDFVYGPLVVALDGCDVPALADYKYLITEWLLNRVADGNATPTPMRLDDREWLRDAARFGRSKYRSKQHMRLRLGIEGAPQDVPVRARPRERRTARAGRSSSSAASRDGPGESDPDDLASPPRRASGLLAFPEAAG